VIRLKINNKPLISIVIVTRNELSDLKVAISSIQKQVFTNYELIIIDGNSNDGTFEFLNSISNLVSLSERDNGPYDAMNKAVQLAKGDFIYFLGSDDSLINSNVLSEVSNCLINHRNKRSIVNFRVIMSESKLAYPSKPIDEVGVIKGDKLCHQGVFFPLNEIKKLGGFDLRFPIASDQDLIIRAIINKMNIVNYETVIASYGPGGLSSHGSLGETTLILIKNRLYLNAIKFFGIEYTRALLIKVQLIKWIRIFRTRWHH
jgi:glycosyltransferase involved in cell wall biosynthesis